MANSRFVTGKSMNNSGDYVLARDFASSPNGTVLDLLLRWVKEKPSSTALKSGSHIVSYKELWEMSQQVGLALVEQGVQRGEVVGLCMTRSAELIVGIMGILLARAAYLPLDPELPVTRLSYMLETAAVKLVIGEKHSTPERLLETGTAFLDISDCLAREQTGHLVLPTQVDMCYVMFTSGSTGKPKGVLHGHAALANLIQWQIINSNCGYGCSTVQYAPIWFDVSFQEIFATLCSGGILVCVNNTVRADPESFWEFLIINKINRLFLPAVALQLLAYFADPALTDLSCLKEIITAGEQLQCGFPIRALFAELSDCRLINQYGPTETHVVTQYKLSADTSSWPDLPPIGLPIQNVELLVLDDSHQPVSKEQVGELYVVGTAVAWGYIGQPKQTAEQFLISAESGQRMYRTGDLVTYNEQGELLFIGRRDQQIKVSGYRVEPGEIEITLLALEGVQTCAVVAVGENLLERVLVAHIIYGDETFEEEQMKNRLRSHLPDYMIPTRLRVVPELPYTRSGKIDRQAVAMNELKLAEQNQ